MEGLTVGRMLHYVVSEFDAAQIKQQRNDRAPENKDGTWNPMGNSVDAGQHLASVVVYVWNKDSGMVNLKCLLDGYDDFWATNIMPDSAYEAREGEDREPNTHTWHWIEKV